MPIIELRPFDYPTKILEISIKKKIKQFCYRLNNSAFY